MDENNQQTNKTIWQKVGLAGSQEWLNKQIAEYNTLSFTKTARGAAIIAISFTLLVTVAYLFVTKPGSDTLVGFIVEMAAYAIMMFFIYKGKRWATITIIVLWTIDKIAQIGTDPATSVTAVVWWYLFMTIYLKNYQVETERKKTAPSLSAPVEVKM